MALVLDESFLSGIPANFATGRGRFSAVTVVYNEAAQAVDLSSSPSSDNDMWDITSQPLRAAGEVEIDLELISDFHASYRHAGLWVVDGTASVTSGMRISHSVSQWGFASWLGTTPWLNGESNAEPVVQGGGLGSFNLTGDRRVINVRWDLTAGAGIRRMSYEVRVDGVVTHMRGPSYGFVSLRPAVHLYRNAVRLHSVKVWDAPQAPLTPTGSRGLHSPIARRICAPSRALVTGGPVTSAFNDNLSRRNTYFGGTGQVTGTVKEKMLPANVPLHRRVCLLEEKTRLLVAETWSDATTGNYVFERIDQTRTYTVMAYDHTGLYRAVIADRLVPEMLT